MGEAEAIEQLSQEIRQTSEQRARDRANAARWDLDVAVVTFAILAIVVILLFQGVGIEVVAPASMFGLAMAWFMGWKKGNQLYERFYEEELEKLEKELSKILKGVVDETIEWKVQRALGDK